MKQLLERLHREHRLSAPEFTALIENRAAVFEQARDLALSLQNYYYDHNIYMRGLIEVSNYCKNDCLYCGIRLGNRKAARYRLTKEEILSCCEEGYAAGYRTFVLQGGEDPWFTDARTADIVETMKVQYPACAVTLSLGERSRESYRILRQAGADRYLLRFETANQNHYSYLHPSDMSHQNRLRCLYDLKDLGYVLGTGFLIGAPGETSSYLGEDMALLCRLQPDMVGVGPFLPHHDTPFGKHSAGPLELTLFLLSLIRIMLPEALLPATTAVNTLSQEGREQAVLHGANVVMPNLSPASVRKKYMLYDGKSSSGAEAVEGFQEMQDRMARIGYHTVVSRGDKYRQP